MVARLTPDQKVGSSNLSAVIFISFRGSVNESLGREAEMRLDSQKNLVHGEGPQVLGGIGFM